MLVFLDGVGGRWVTVLGSVPPVERCFAAVVRGSSAFDVDEKFPQGHPARPDDGCVSIPIGLSPSKFQDGTALGRSDR